ncbi:MAG: hypothetical protein SVO96_01250 [Pseudomonadota bacterium]|nr:hypothetical protein [Pseudomonadota bacterium]
MSVDSESHSLNTHEFYLVFDEDVETNAGLEEKFKAIVAGHDCSSHIERVNNVITIQARTSSLACAAAIKLTLGSYVSHSGKD